MEGNYQKATPEYVNKLMEVIDKDPEELGYEFGRWTAQRLATYLEGETGNKVKRKSNKKNIKIKKVCVYLGKV